MTHSKLSTLLPPNERREHRELNRQKILRFLRQEIWSTADVLRQVVGLGSRQGISKVLIGLQFDGVVHRHEICLINDTSVVLWGITAHGQAMAFEPDSEKIIPVYFEPSKIHESTLKHTLDIQRLRLNAENCGWTGWTNGDRLPVLLNGDRRPDAVSVSPRGELFAIEVERTIKTVKRYQVILASYLRAIKLNEVSKVAWICPTNDIARRLSSIVTGISYVTVEGQRIVIDPTRHHVHLMFMSYQQFEDAAPNL